MCFNTNHPNALTGESSATISNPTTPDGKVTDSSPDWVKRAGIAQRREEVAQRRANAGLKDDTGVDDVLDQARKRMGMKLLQSSSRRDALANGGGAYSLLK